MTLLSILSKINKSRRFSPSFSNEKTFNSIQDQRIDKKIEFSAPVIFQFYPRSTRRMIQIRQFPCETFNSIQDQQGGNLEASSIVDLAFNSIQDQRIEDLQSASFRHSVFQFYPRSTIFIWRRS